MDLEVDSVFWKKADPIEITFEVVGWVDSKNHVLKVGLDPHWKGQILEKMGQHSGVMWLWDMASSQITFEFLVSNGLCLLFGKVSLSVELKSAQKEKAWEAGKWTLLMLNMVRRKMLS